MDCEFLFTQAKSVILDSIKIGEEFKVSELFAGHDWNKIEGKDRRKFGRYFSDKYKNGYLPFIEKSRESGAHHTIYKRIK